MSPPLSSTKLRVVLLLVLAVLPLGVSCESNEPSETVQITVAAASDLTSAFEELGRVFTSQTKTRVVYVFGSTGMLTQQIAHGAPFDVFVAANRSYVKALEQQGLILPDTIAIYARGRIVMWTTKNARFKPQTLQDLLRSEVQRIAIANPDHAPYGTAARQALESAKLWEGLKNKIIYADNVRQALQFAQTGNVDVAIIALSLTFLNEGDGIQIPEELHQPLDQALAVIKSTRRETEARAFALFVTSSTGQTIMSRYGFVYP